VVHGATCDNTILDVSSNKLRCGDIDFILIIGIVSGSALILGLLVVLVVVYSCYRSREPKYHCDYLQYVPTSEDKRSDLQDLQYHRPLPQPYTESKLDFFTDQSMFQQAGEGNISPYQEYGLSTYQLPSETLARKFSTRLRNPNSVLNREDESAATNSPKKISSRDFYSAKDSPVLCEMEPLYYTVTTNPLEEYSSGYHGSSSVYTNSSTSSGGSTLPNHPRSNSVQQGTHVLNTPPSSHVLSQPQSSHVHNQLHSSHVLNFQPSGTSTHMLPVHFERPQNSHRTLGETKKDKFPNVMEKRNGRFPDILPFKDKGQSYLV